MYGIENYFGFLLAGIMLNLIPGSDTIYILTRTISQGQKAGVYSVLGVSTGILVHTLLAAFGLSIILTTSINLYNIVKIIGAVYLILIGLKTIFSKNELIDTKEPENKTIKSNQNRSKLYFQGVFTNVLNPKVALFFISFLPQFINTQKAKGPIPFLILGLTFISTATIWCLFLVFASSSVSKTLRTNKNINSILQKVSGSIFIILGLKIATDRS